MTPLAKLLEQAITVAQIAKPELTERAIAEAAGLEPANLSRAKKACSPHTLAAVLVAIQNLTGAVLDVQLVMTTDPTEAPRTA